VLCFRPPVERTRHVHSHPRWRKWSILYTHQPGECLRETCNSVWLCVILYVCVCLCFSGTHPSFAFMYTCDSIYIIYMCLLVTINLYSNRYSAYTCIVLIYICGTKSYKLSQRDWCTVIIIQACTHFCGTGSDKDSSCLWLQGWAIGISEYCGRNIKLVLLLLLVLICLKCHITVVMISVSEAS